MMCTICLENIEAPLTQKQKMKRLSNGLCSNIKQEEIEKLFCKHCFHKKCLNRWISVASTCPICREKIVYYKKVRLKLYYPYTWI